MGKGSRNRQRHVQEQLNSSGRQNKQAKKAPKWLTPLISILLAAVILVGLIASVLTNSGIIYRNRIIVESKTGNYDVTQQTATFLAWQSAYYNAYYYWYYAYLGYITDKTVTTQYTSADAYAFDNYAKIKCVEVDGSKWAANYVEINRPRIKITIGSLYETHDSKTTTEGEDTNE